MFTLENERVRVGVKAMGAEITSLVDKRDGAQHLWQGDPAVWPGQAPLLFPVVGRLKDDTYLYGSESYALCQHGFARKSVFDCTEQLSNRLVFELKSSDKTRAMYPFDFTLRVIYTLVGDGVAITYEVVNDGAGTMPFSIGAHPGFNVPVVKDDAYADYQIEFEKEEKLTRLYIRSEDGLLVSGHPFEGKMLAIQKGLFDKGAWVFDGVKSEAFTLRSTRSGRGVRVESPGFPQLGIWAMPDAPYVCIEPWFGLSDFAEHDQVFEQKKGLLSLEAGKMFECVHTIRVL